MRPGRAAPGPARPAALREPGPGGGAPSARPAAAAPRTRRRAGGRAGGRRAARAGRDPCPTAGTRLRARHKSRPRPPVLFPQRLRVPLAASCQLALSRGSQRACTYASSTVLTPPTSTNISSATLLRIWTLATATQRSLRFTSEVYTWHPIDPFHSTVSTCLPTCHRTCRSSVLLLTHKPFSLHHDGTLLYPRAVLRPSPASPTHLPDVVTAVTPHHQHTVRMPFLSAHLLHAAAPSRASAGSSTQSLQCSSIPSQHLHTNFLPGVFTHLPHP